MTVNQRPYTGVTAQASGGKVLRHGLNSSIPMICRGCDCPYKITCNAPEELHTVGKPCFHELAAVLWKAYAYCHELKVTAQDHDSLRRIRHLITLDVKLSRCNRLFAANPHMVYVALDEFGNYRKKLNPILHYELIITDEHRKVINTLRKTANLDGQGANIPEGVTVLPRLRLFLPVMTQMDNLLP